MLNLHSRLLLLSPYCLGLLTQSQSSYYSSPWFHHRGQTPQKGSQIALYCPEFQKKVTVMPGIYSTHYQHEQILTASFFTLTEKTGTETCCRQTYSSQQFGKIEPNTATHPCIGHSSSVHIKQSFDGTPLSHQNLPLPPHTTLLSQPPQNRRHSHPHPPSHQTPLHWPD